MVVMSGTILGPSSSFIGVLHFVLRFAFHCKLSLGHCRSVCLGEKRQCGLEMNEFSLDMMFS